MLPRSESLARARAQLRSVPGVERVVIDDQDNVIVVICCPGSNRDEISEAAGAALAELDLPGDTQLEITVRADQRERQRVRFAGVTRTVRQDHRYDLTVQLEWNERTASATMDSERGEGMELRAIAMAALDALRQLVDEDLDLRVAGVKQVRSFDTDLVVASLYRPGTPPQHFVGAVVAGKEPHRAAAIAVLNALNRHLGNYLAR